MSGTVYPGSIDNIQQPGPNDVTNVVSHAGTHDSEILAIQAIEAKLGTGASTATANKVLRATGTGTTAYAQVGLTTDVTGTLPATNGGTGVTSSTGSGSVVLSTSPALTTPVFSSIVNTGTLTLPTSSDTLVGRATTDVLTNKDLTSATNTLPTSLVKTVKIQKFTASGTYTPSTNMLYCIIELVGGGGGGGGSAVNASYNVYAAGGGAGAYSRKVVTAATIGVSQTVTIGTAGNAATAGANNGGSGGTTSVGSICTAGGGTGATFVQGALQVSSAGTGGTAGTGDIASTGSPGFPGLYSGVVGQDIQALGGHGGASIFGGNGVGAVNGSGGAAAANSGSGGAGGSSYHTGSNSAGGAGGSGLVVITEYCGS